MKYSIISKEVLEILIDKDEAILLIDLLENKNSNNDFKASLIWHIKTFINNSKGD